MLTGGFDIPMTFIRRSRGVEFTMIVKGLFELEFLPLVEKSTKPILHLFRFANV